MPMEICSGKKQSWRYKNRSGKLGASNYRWRLYCCCETNSNDGDAIGNHGNYDFLIVKLKCFGSIVWKKLLGGSGLDKAHSACQLSDGGYMAAGETYSNNGNVSGNHGQSDYWVVKLDANGNLLWQHCFGGTAIDMARSVSAAPDGK
jgi:hypothetical protein